MEFLMGRSLLNTLYNLGIKDQYMGEPVAAAAAVVYLHVMLGLVTCGVVLVVIKDQCTGAHAVMLLHVSWCYVGASNCSCVLGQHAVQPGHQGPVHG
jgi:hypothetical protein